MYVYLKREEYMREYLCRDGNIIKLFINENGVLIWNRDNHYINAIKFKDILKVNK